MALIKLNKDNFDEIVNGSESKVLIDFYADWCGPCKMLAPTIEAIAQDHPELTICKVNVDDDVDLAIKYGIESIPTIIVTRSGEVVSRAVGVRTKEYILTMLKEQ